MSIPEGEGVRCVWLYTEDGSPDPQVQTVTLYLRGRHATKLNLQELIEVQVRMLQHQQQSGGDEIPTLVPLTLMLMLYAASGEPEIDWPPAEQIARPTPIKDSRIGNLGWRVGAALRQWRKDAGARGGREPREGGWHLPPHIRKAHWHRVRVAERDERGVVVGDRLGAEGVDWHYEVRWYPPTPVNADAGIAPAVRDV